ncbi:MAG: flagellar basal-body rod protein FlgF [Myxococcota bacterium]
MSDGIYSALSGAIAQERNLSVVANNVANAGTTGFRADRVAFRETLAGASGDPDVVQPLRYVGVAEVGIDAAPGTLESTGAPLDLALQGEGLFALQTNAGVRYTRAGSFRTDAEGLLRSPGGHQVLSAEGNPNDPRTAEIRIPEDAAEIVIGSDGTIHADGAEVGRLRIVRFDLAQLEKEGLTLFRAPDPLPAVLPGEVQVVQGSLETSNMNAVQGMTELITASRAFDAFQKVIDNFKQIDERAARDLAAR